MRNRQGACRSIACVDGAKLNGSTYPVAGSPDREIGDGPRFPAHAFKSRSRRCSGGALGPAHPADRGKRRQRRTTSIRRSSPKTVVCPSNTQLDIRHQRGLGDFQQQLQRKRLITMAKNTAPIAAPENVPDRADAPSGLKRSAHGHSTHRRWRPRSSDQSLCRSWSPRSGRHVDGWMPHRVRVAKQISMCSRRIAG